MTDYKPMRAEELRPLAEGGDMKAQFELGNRYGFGKGVEKNDAEAAK